MNELSQKRTCTEVLEALHAIPKGLPAIYSQMLLKIENRHRCTSSTILRWITTAFRPLTLKELAAAIGLQSPSTLITMEEAVRDQIALCGLLLKVQEQGVSLVHQSARDYLLRNDPDSDPDLDKLRINPEKAHLELARTCFDCVVHCYLQYRHFYCSQEFPLLNYAILHWPEHVRRCPTLAAELFDLSNPFFQKDPGLRDAWWDAYRLAKSRFILRTPPLLHMVCHLGIVPWVVAILSKNSWMPMFRRLVNKKDNTGQTALRWAAQGGHEAMVRLLVERGADINANDGHFTVLHWAVERGHEAVVRLLIDCGADINAKVASGTALHVAARGGNEAVVRLLVDRGADINMKDDLYTALHAAAGRGHEAMVRLLVERGADINANDGHFTVLHWAVKRGHEAVIRLLIDYGADINAKNVSGTALHAAAQGGNKAVVQLLIDCGADIHAKNDYYGRTALHLAAQRGYKAVVQLLIDYGIDINARDNKRGVTALHLAAERGYEAVVQLLIDYGADIHTKDNHEATVLHWAAKRQDRIMMVKLLVNLGVDIHARDDCGATALHWAAERLNEAMVYALVECGADDDRRVTALHRAAERGQKAVVRLFNSARKFEGWFYKGLYVITVITQLNYILLIFSNLYAKGGPGTSS